MRDPMYPDTITLWRPQAPSGGSQGWIRAVLAHVRVEERKGAARGSVGDSALDDVGLLVRGDSMAPSAGDAIAVGEAAGNVPPGDAWSVTYCDTVRIGSSVHHYEAGASR